MILDFKNEDALVYVRSLPSASIDLVLTDPPLRYLKRDKLSEWRRNRHRCRPFQSVLRFW